MNYVNVERTGVWPFNCTAYFLCLMLAPYLFLLQVDIYGYRYLTYPLEWMGKHALSIFILVSSNLAVIAIQGFYWKAPENNIVSVHINGYFSLSTLILRYFASQIIL